MTPKQYLRLLRRRGRLIVLVAVLVLAGFAASTYFATPKYTSTVQLFVRVDTRSSDVSALQSGSSFTQERVKTYADIVTSPLVLQKVKESLALPMSTQELADRVTATTPLDTVLLDVSVEDTSPSRAASIATEIARQFPAFAEQLETPDRANASPVKISVSRPATVPESPSSPNMPLNLFLGLVLGLVAGVAAAAVRDALDTRVSAAEDVQKVTGAVPLGAIPYDEGVESQPLVSFEERSPRAEALRSLRTNLRFANVDQPPRVIVLTSAVPGEGKTTTAVNLASILAMGGDSVLLIEGDLRKPMIGKYLGVSSSAGLTDVLAGVHELRDVLVPFRGDRFVILPSGPMPPNPSELLGSRQMVNLISDLSESYDFVVIDAPPLLPVTDAAVLATAADGALLVARHGRTSKEQLQEAVQALQIVNANLLGAVLNFAPVKEARGYGDYVYSPPSKVRAGARPAHGRAPLRAETLNGSANGFETAPPTRRRDRKQ